MDDITLLIIASLISIIIWTWILYEIISSATRAKKRDQLLTIQIRLLSELLLKNGVTPERINQIKDLSQGYFDFKGHSDNK